MEIRTGDTHYMTFPHDTSGLRRADFTYQLLKDGQLILDIAVEVVEFPANTYTFSFVNDGTHESHWSLLAWQTSNADVKYGESWKVRDDVVRKTVLGIDAELTSGSGNGGNGVTGSVGPAIGKG